MPLNQVCENGLIKSRIYSSNELESLDMGRIPGHVAIIPDGNRRWAKRQSSSVSEGHQEGADTLMDVVKAGKELGIKIFTFYIFSTENWTRDPEEIEALMWLLQSYLIDQRQTMINDGIRFLTIGNLSRFPVSVVDTIEETVKATEACDKVDMVFALNYGGRDEICRAFHRMIEELENGKLKKDEITEAKISHYLDTAPWKDPDLLIRTSGEYRVSNFLLWQISYSEVYVDNVLWPDFKPKHLLEALLSYQKRERRLGGT